MTLSNLECRYNRINIYLYRYFIVYYVVHFFNALTEKNIFTFGNTLFDFNPFVFRHLFDQLQLFEGKIILPPSDPSLIRPFEKNVEKTTSSTFNITIN